MSKILFISFHRIGVKTPASIQTASYQIVVEEQVPDTGYVDLVASRLGEFDEVFAYAGLETFDGLVEILVANPERLHIVTCDCDEVRRISLLRRHKLDKSVVYWTRACGGQQKMGELINFVRDNDTLPPE